MKSEILIMKFESSLKQKLKNYAKKQKRTMTSIVEELIENKLNSLKK